MQHSADGSAYEQYAGIASLLAQYFTGGWPHGVSCGSASAGKADLASALREMAATFGPSGREGIVVGVTTDRSAKINNGSAAVVHAQGTPSPTVASGRWPTPSSTGSAKCDMPVMCGMPQMAVWAGSAQLRLRARRAAVLSRAEAALA